MWNRLLIALKKFLFEPIIKKEIASEIPVPEAKPITIYSKCLTNLENIKIPSFKLFNNAGNSLVTFKTPIDRLPALNQKIKDFNAFILSEKKIYSGAIVSTVTVVKAQDFFLSEDRYYIDEVHYIRQLIFETTRYIRLIEGIEELKGVNSYNKRALTSFTTNLIALIEQLAEVK